MLGEWVLNYSWKLDQTDEIVRNLAHHFRQDFGTSWNLRINLSSSSLLGHGNTGWSLRENLSSSPGNLTTWLILVYTCIYWDVLRTSWVLRCYSRTPYENQGNRISRYILSISRDLLLAKSISPYMWSTTFGRVTQYMSVYLSMKFSDKVYPRISWVHACLYLYSSFFCPEWEGTYSYIVLRLRTYDVQLHFPACARPAGLHPAGQPAPCRRAWIWKQHIRDRDKTHLFKNK
jgi:hypothetical protein